MKSNYLNTKQGARLFAALAEADPKSALECLKRTIGAWPKDDLLRFEMGRREVVWALEKIAVWRDLFPDAARLLLKLGEAETEEKISNNASGIFAQLFSLSYGRVASTEAPPYERFPVLIEALESSSKEKRLLGLKACDRALDFNHLTRMIGAEYQGLRREPQLWTPKTYGELFDAIRFVWKTLSEKSETLPAEDERQEAINVMVHNTIGIGRTHNLSVMVVETLKDLAQKSPENKKNILPQVINMLHHFQEELTPELREKWKGLEGALTGDDFPSLMRRYVSMDIFEDRFDAQGNLVDQAVPKIKKLAEISIREPDLLKRELSWLVTMEAQNGYRYGYELGKQDIGFSLLPALVEAQRNATKDASGFFLGGYFRALFEHDQEGWEKQLDLIAEDTELKILVPEITWRSRLTDRAALRILCLAEKGDVATTQFSMFSTGGVIHNLSEEVFKKWMDFLIAKAEHEAVYIALNLFYFFYIFKGSKYCLPRELTLKLLTHPLLFKKYEKSRYRQMKEHYWTEIGKAFVRAFAEKGIELAVKCLEHIGEDGTILAGFNSTTLSVLDEITREYPSEIWDITTKYLGPPIDERGYHITQWLQGGTLFQPKDGVLSLIPLDKIWKWVDKNPEKRAWYLATFVPKRLFREKGKVCLARELLIRFGEREDVRRNLRANFSTEGWTGPASLHLKNKRQELIDFRKGEEDENVKLWLDEYISLLEKEIQVARMEEERDDF